MSLPTRLAPGQTLTSCPTLLVWASFWLPVPALVLSSTVGDWDLGVFPSSESLPQSLVGHPCSCIGGAGLLSVTSHSS